MDKELHVKVTRLRHSVAAETEDVKSPSTSNTPKKRGGKLATKPQLELIHENATTEEIEPKKRRRSTARVTEVDEKVLTPSRRSTRIRSNTSNTSETPTETEDKGTPSRRSTRVRSNTSLIAETVQYEHSPRAQRAARRTSLAGSDTESTIFPVKQTRRTRRDSTSSIDKKAETNVSKLGIQPNLVIIEEKLDKDEDETKVNETTSKEINESPSIRRSPRLVEKSGKKSLSPDGQNKENEPEKVKTGDRSKSDLKTDNFVESSMDQAFSSVTENEINNPSTSTSLSSNDLEIKSKKKHTALNNSTSALDKPLSKSKRQRTKSWSTISSSHASDHSFLSDTEAMKQKTRKNTSIISGFGDSLLKASSNKVDKDKSLNLSMISKMSKKSITGSNTDIVDHVNTDTKLNLSSREINSSQQDSVILGKSPKCLVKSIVFIEDTDSNASTTDKANINYEVNTEDQCVPVVEHDPEAAETQNNLSYEPMDIDETITENTSAILSNNPVEEIQNNSILHNNSKKFSKEDMTSDCNKSVNRSKRKSSIPNIEGIKTEINTNENKNCSNSITVTNNGDTSQISSNIDLDQNKSMNASNSDKTLSTQDHDDSAKVNKSNRKLSFCDTSIEGKIKKIKEMSSISTINDVDNNSSILTSDHVKVNKSRNEYVCDNRDIENINSDSVNKSKSISFSTDNVSKSKDNNSKSLTEDTINISSNNCGVTSSIEKGLLKTPNASSKPDSSLISNDVNNGESPVAVEIETSNKSFKKEKRKFVVSNKDNENTNESVNKSSRNCQFMESQTLDKTNNENKSTLILSQIKDTSETNFEINEPLSKSLDIPNIKTDIEKKNLSFAYSTSTPLQQKSLKNLGMQINTSDINSKSDQNKNKSEKKLMAIKSNKKYICLQSSDEDNSNEDDEEDNSDEEIEEKNMFIDAEAEEANEDYESGDSRDDDEKEYEEQNVIVDKGESLDFEEDDFSNDSEYERDSFVVDSDEEDNNLLSGSGDDLGMSDDELDMSAKSKKKFNARKIKEQKKASREMFNARHEQEESNNSISDKQKPKKVNRRRLDSSDLGVEKENTPQSKISRRARIDSSQDISRAESDVDNSILVKKKKTKRLTESVCEDEETISINQSINTENIDPLTLQNVIKQEPKTPQKDLNISTTIIKNTEEFENVEIDENLSLNKMKLNISADPLQNTMAQDDATDSDESISENEEITKNYDTILNNLNTIKVKTTDTSLNLNKKAKLKAKEPIIDELNLTQAKSKKTKTKVSDDQLDMENVSKDASKIKVNMNISTNHDEDSSDSIDIKLLFNEDSTDSDNKIAVEEATVNHIPLKRTDGKINILENDEETETVSFFIDTKGTHTDDKKESKEDPTINTSGKKKKNSSISFSDTEEVKDAEPEVDISVSASNKKNKKKLSLNEQETAKPVLNISASGSDKKKKKLSFSLDEQETEDAEVNISASGSNKKKKKKLSLSLDEQETEDAEVNISASGSDEKKKKKSSLSLDEQETVDAEVNISASGSDKKKKKKLSLSLDEQETVDAEVNISASGSDNKKKKKLSLSLDEQETEDAEVNISASGSDKKKKKKLSLSLDEQETEDAEVNSSASGSDKKKKKKSSLSLDEQETVDTEVNIIASGRDKKKKKKLSLSLDGEETVEQAVNVSTYVPDKKRKLSSSLNEEKIEEPEPTVDLTSTKKKKSKNMSLSLNEQEADEQVVNASVSDSNKKKKKKLFSSPNEQEKDIDNAHVSSVIKQNYITTSEEIVQQTNEIRDNEGIINEEVKTKKRKRKRSANQSTGSEDILNMDTLTNEPVVVTNEKKKRKRAHKEDNVDSTSYVLEVQENNHTQQSDKKKKNKSEDEHLATDNIKKNKKRKHSDIDDNVSKDKKHDFGVKGIVPRLPAKIIKQLSDKPKKENHNISKATFVSTTSFKVEKTEKKRMKPSNYLEQSVYLNDSIEEKSKKSSLLRPKVWPSVPTVSLSNQGFTTNFKVDIIPKDTKFVFVAQSNDVTNFKQNFLHKNRINKLGTFEMYKRGRNKKLSKF